MEQREISTKRYVASFLIGTVIFVLVMSIASYLSYIELRRVAALQMDSSYEIFEDKLIHSFFQQGTCSKESITEISEDLGFQGKIIDDLERKLGKTNPDVLNRKRFYTLIELEHLEFIKMLNENCNTGINTILFFYSNFDKDLERSEEFGNLLSVVYNGDPEKVFIYSFDVNLDSNLIENLKKKYSIETEQAIVINENQVLTDVTNINDILQYLN